MLKKVSKRPPENTLIAFYIGDVFFKMLRKSGDVFLEMGGGVFLA